MSAALPSDSQGRLHLTGFRIKHAREKNNHNSPSALQTSALYTQTTRTAALGVVQTRREAACGSFVLGRETFRALTCGLSGFQIRSLSRQEPSLKRTCGETGKSGGQSPKPGQFRTV